MEKMIKRRLGADTCQESRGCVESRLGYREHRNVP